MVHQKTLHVAHVLLENRKKGDLFQASIYVLWGGSGSVLRCNAHLRSVPPCGAEDTLFLSGIELVSNIAAPGFVQQIRFSVVSFEVWGDCSSSSNTCRFYRLLEQD